MDKWILKALLPSVFLGTFTLVVSGGRFCRNPTPPVCADDCNGNGYYLNEDETECIQCPTCPAGQELNKACGNGVNGDAVCRSCPDGYFSTSTSRQCSPCTTCINTIELETCQVTQDRVCGDCLPGFARSSDRFSAADPNACPEQIAIASLEPAPVEQPVPVEPPGSNDVSREMACEPTPPRCIDPCDDGNYYLDYDGLCKACLQCQPGEQLNKVCGEGKNGDAHCRRCPEGTFSVDGIGRCTPCRICINTVATECTAIRDSECGECLPGYYQDADGFFPDKGACPNKCMCPTTIPQCQEWCESKVPTEEVTMSAAQPTGQGAVSPQAVFPSAPPDNYIDVEVPDPAPAKDGSYTTIFTVLASLLAVIIVILIIVLVVFRHFWKKTASSNASITAETALLPDPNRTPSPGSSPGGSPLGFPSTVYNPTTSPLSPSENQWEFMNYLSTFFLNQNGERPVSGSSSDSENRSSVVSTPTMNLNRRLADKNMKDLRRHALERQFGTDPNDPSRSNPQHQPPNLQRMNHPSPLPGRESRPTQLEVPKSSDQEPNPNERLNYAQDKSSPRVSSSSKVFTEKESGTVHQHVEDQDEAPGRLVRRRSSIISIGNNDEQNGSPHNDSRPQRKFGKSMKRRYSLPCLPLVSDVMPGKVGTGSTSPVHEAEAALFPPDSPSDDGRTTNVLATDTNNKKTTSPKQQDRRSGPVTSIDHVDAGATVPNRSLAILPEKCPNETTPEKKSTHADPGNKSSKRIRNTSNMLPGGFTININMNTKDIEKFHVGDVHSSHTYAHQTTTVSENDDEDEGNDEAEKLLNLSTSESDTIPEPHTYPHQTTTGFENHDEDDEEDEAEGLLDMTTSENDTIPEPDNHTCCDEDDDEDDEEDKLLNPK